MRATIMKGFSAEKLRTELGQKMLEILFPLTGFGYVTVIGHCIFSTFSFEFDGTATTKLAVPCPTASAVLRIGVGSGTSTLNTIFSFIKSRSCREY